ncbi:unnamed protein product [Parnassius apollo]|uniref:(apollo) hypothetical protein n=1 Tax=Parnassius apollo TaxID=110799 RepID=A0A8S3X4H5_PARAO|nr:unnamed protein product [Parnassius apollo]
MWNPGNKPVPQEFIDVLLDEEELDIDEDHGELVEEYDAEEILNIPVDTKRASGSPQCPTVEMSGEVHVLDVPAPEPAPEVPGEVHVLDVPAPEVPGEVHVLNVPAPESAPGPQLAVRYR